MSSKTVGSQKERSQPRLSSEDAKSLQQTQGGVGGVNLEAQRQQQNRQQELYTWLQAEYTLLVQQQEAIKKHKEGSEAHSRLHDEYKKRHSAYQVKLEEYHQCQQAILDAAKKAGGATQVPSSSGARGVTATATLTKRVAAKGAATVKSKPSEAVRASMSQVGKVGATKNTKNAAQAKAQAQAQMHQQQRQMDQAVEPAERPMLSAEMSGRMRAVVAQGKRPATDYRGLEIIEDTPEYQDRYQELRWKILQRCLDLGKERKCGTTLWHGYWNGLRAFILYRTSRQEFEFLLVKQLALPADVLRLHNSLIATLLMNIRAAATSHLNVALLPYVLTEEEIGELRPGAVEAEAMEREESGGGNKEAPLFFPLLDGASWREDSSQHIKPEPIVEEALVAADTVLGALVSSLHGDVLAARPSVEVSRAGNANTVILRLPVKSCEIEEKEKKRPVGIKKEKGGVKRGASGDSLASLSRDPPSPVKRVRGAGLSQKQTEEENKEGKEDDESRGISSTRSGLKVTKQATRPQRRSERL